MSYSIGALAEIINGKVVGNSSAVIEGVASFDQPKAGCVTFILNPKDLPDLEKSAIACIITPKSVAQSAKPIIQVDNPKLAFAKITSLFFPDRKYHGFTSPKASITPSAKIGKNVTVEALAFIGERCTIGDNSVIRAFSYIDDDTVIGKDAIIHPSVTIYSKTIIGNRVIIHAGATIGSDGFGYVFDGQKQEKVPQVGNVVIEDDVEIGAGTTIDRAAIGQTKIGQGTKIDNQVQIAHNVEIGRHCAISAHCGISGSCKIGNYVTMGGGVGIADHVEVGDGAMLGANAGVPPGKKIPPKTIWFGQPARPYEVMRKQLAAQLRASENQEELRALKKTLTQLLQEFEALKSSIKS